MRHPRLVLALSLAAALPTLAADDKTPPPNKATDSRPASVAVVDPVTGRLRPATAEELKRLTASSRREALLPSDRPRVEVRPDGSKVGYLDDSYMTHVVVKQRPDGSLTYVCADSGAEAKEALKAPPAPPRRAPRLEEK